MATVLARFMNPEDPAPVFNFERVLWSAGMSCVLSYSDDPLATLQQQQKAWLSPNHRLTLAAHTNKSAPHHYVMTVEPSAVCKDNTIESVIVYIAFQGTKSVDHVLTDIQAMGVPPFGTFIGKIHLGFLRKAMQIKIQPIINLLKEGKITVNGKMTDVSQVVFCGHSLGGAIAQLVALRVAMDHWIKDSEIEKIYVIGFGTPLVGDEDFCQFAHNLIGERTHFFLYDTDIVPRLMAIFQNFIESPPHIAEKKNKNALWKGIKNILRASNENNQGYESAMKKSLDFVKSQSAGLFRAAVHSTLQTCVAAVTNNVITVAFSSNFGRYYKSSTEYEQQYDDDGVEKLVANHRWRKCDPTLVCQYFGNTNFDTVSYQHHALRHYTNFIQKKVSKFEKASSASWGCPEINHNLDEQLTSTWRDSALNEDMWKLCIIGTNLSHVSTVTINGITGSFQPSPLSNDTQIVLNFAHTVDQRSITVTFHCDIGTLREQRDFSLRKFQPVSTECKNGRIAVMKLHELIMNALSFSLLGTLSGDAMESDSVEVLSEKLQDGLQRDVFDILCSFQSMQSVNDDKSLINAPEVEKFLSQPGVRANLAELISKDKLKEAAVAAREIVEVANIIAQRKASSAAGGGGGGGGAGEQPNNSTSTSPEPRVIEIPDESPFDELFDSFEDVRDGSLRSRVRRDNSKSLQYWLQRSVKVAFKCQLRIASLQIAVKKQWIETLEILGGAALFVAGVGLFVFGGWSIVGVPAILEGGVMAGAAAYAGGMGGAAAVTVGVAALFFGASLVVEKLTAIDREYSKKLLQITTILGIETSQIPLLDHFLENLIVQHLNNQYGATCATDIMNLYTDQTFLNQDLKNVLPESKHMTVEFMSCVYRVHKLREILTSCFTFGVMGTMKTGKSTFLSSLGFAASMSEQHHTHDIEMHFFPMENLNNFRFLDFPGNDDLMAVVANCFNKYHNIADAFIFVIEADKPDTVWLQNMLKVVRKLKRPILICINKADTFLEIKGTVPTGYSKPSRKKNRSPKQFKDKNQLKEHVVEVVNKLFDTSTPDPLRHLKNITAFHTILDNDVLDDLVDSKPNFAKKVEAAEIRSTEYVLRHWIIPRLEDEKIKFDKEALWYLFDEDDEAEEAGAAEETGGQ
jgi:hypothetical protein